MSTAVHKAAESMETDRPEPDGRIARGIRTRESILVAFEELILELEGAPTGSELAARAGVSPRSVFTHFGDMDGVLAATARRAFDWVVATYVEIPLDASLAERVDRFSARQGETLERTAPIYRALKAMRHGVRRERCTPTVGDMLRGTELLRRNYIQHLFGRELDGLSPEGRSDLLAAVMAATSWSLWDGLRRDQGVAYDQAVAVVRLGLRGLLLHAEA